MVTENDIHTDFIPSEAPMWSIGITFEENPQCLLSEYLNEISALCHQHETMQQVTNLRNCTLIDLIPILIISFRFWDHFTRILHPLLLIPIWIPAQL